MNDANNVVAGIVAGDCNGFAAFIVLFAMCSALASLINLNRLVSARIEDISASSSRLFESLLVVSVNLNGFVVYVL